MKVLIVNYIAHNDGGAGASTFLMAQKLQQAGVNVYIASLAPYPGFKTFVFRDFRLLPFFGWRDMYLSRFISRVIKKHAIDIIHSSECRFTAPACVKAGRKHRIGVVCHYRGYSFCCPNGVLIYRQKKACSGMSVGKCLACGNPLRLLWEAYRYLYVRKKADKLKAADAHIAISFEVKKELERSGIRRGVRVVYNPFEQTPEIGSEEAKKKYGARGPVVAFVGGLFYHKGIKIFLEIIPELNRIRDGLTFLIAGNGELMPYCRDFIARHGLDNVRMLRDVSREETGRVYAAADVVVYPLLQTGFGRIPVEAALASRPVVASDTAGIEEAVTDGETGFLVGINDRQRWVSRIVKLIDDPVLRAKMGRRARDKAVRQFSSERMVSGLLSIYEELSKKYGRNG